MIRVGGGPELARGSLPEAPGHPRRSGPADHREAGRMDEHSTRVAELLHEAAETHHQVFRITEGADDDWASWYGQWLVTLSELLVLLDKEYRDRCPAERWEDYYARELVRHFGPG